MASRLQLVMASTVLALSATWTTARPPDDALPTCPVTGEAIDFNVSTMTDNGPVFFCCKKCIRLLEKKPAKFASAVAEQRKMLEKRDRVQVVCPVTGEPVDPEQFIEQAGKKVSFCCKHCAPKFKANPDKYKAKLAASYTYQTKCPISGEEIDPSTSVVLPSGNHIYTCCNKCARKVSASAEKVAASVAEQGYNFTVEEIKKAKPAENEDKDGDHDDD